jgi:DNA polymerase-3 subunit alpha/error-prone DNA polymerase
VEASAVRIGLKAIKHLTQKARLTILRERPFTNCRDLLARVPLGYRELEALVLRGACDGLEPLTLALYPVAHQEMLARLAQQRTPGALDGFVAPGPHGERGEMYRALVRIHNELRFLGMHVYDHPMRVLREETSRAGCIGTSELITRLGQTVRIAGLVAASRRLATQGGQVMQFVTLEDEQGLVEAALFPSAYGSHGDPITNPRPFLVAGRVAEDHGNIHLVLSEVMPFYRREHPYDRRPTP